MSKDTGERDGPYSVTGSCTTREMVRCYLKMAMGYLKYIL